MSAVLASSPQIVASRTQPVVTVPVPVAELFAVVTEYLDAGRLDAAERMLNHVLTVYPALPDVLHMMGLIAFRRGQIPEAGALMERAIAGGGTKSAHFRNLSEVYRLQGRLDEALATARRAVALDPSDPLGPFNLGMVQYDRLDVTACIAAARHSLDLRPSLPQAHMKLAQALLLSCQFAQGWEEYEWRYQIPGAQPLMPPSFTAHHKRPQWDGSPLGDQRLLLIGDQGFGDVVMFARYIPWARERCPEIVLACSAEMKPIMEAMFPGVQLINRWDDCPDHAAFIPLSGLPRLHGTRLDTIPGATPYMHADPALAKDWRGRLDARIPQGLRRVGIAWAGRPTHNNDLNRSITLQTLAPIAALDGIALVSLQKGPATAQIASYAGTTPLIDLDKEIGDFADTMAIIDGLDLVVTVDTAIGHFAGAMGKPAWIMLPYAPDWRWLLSRDDTPWYPSLRLFRNSAPKRWDLLVPEVAAELQRFVAHHLSVSRIDT
jgi:hypothetical protein